jgi:hypothetical protein
LAHVTPLLLPPPHENPVHPPEDPPELPPLPPLLPPLLLLFAPPSPKTVAVLSEPHPADADRANPAATKRREAI